MVKLKFTTITPLHISNGEFLDQNFHYKVADNRIFRIDQNKLSALLTQKEKIDFSQNITSLQIEKWISKHQIDIMDKASSYSLEYDDAFKEHLKNSRANGQRQIIEFINTSGKFYIPASSIKGALITILKSDHLGIKEQRQQGELIKEADIKDKFVIHDSNSLPEEIMMVYRTNNRPPAVNLICIKPNTTFSLYIYKLGALSLDELKRKLQSYWITQKETALRSIVKFKSRNDQLKGADYFEKALERLNLLKLIDGEYVINLGFGGGSWFKVEEGTIPKFRSKSPNPRRRGTDEEAHTTFSININDTPQHIGWCKLKIEEE